MVKSYGVRVFSSGWNRSEFHSRFLGLVKPTDPRLIHVVSL